MPPISTPFKNEDEIRESDGENDDVSPGLKRSRVFIGDASKFEKKRESLRDEKKQEKD